ncbi:MAG TPA: hypothetical protein VLG12_06775 [Candidatus Saccharimonadales bacterium]|nr:hypothetical protein [Candidatus Saccharimonadales bacterium]
MAKSKKKITKFKNIPLKKEPQEKKTTKKKEVTVPNQIPPETSSRKDFINPSETFGEPKQTEIVEEIKADGLKETSWKGLHPKGTSYSVAAQNPSGMITSYFPKISRVITERWFLIGLVSGVLLVGIIIIAGNIQANIEERKNLEQKRAKIKQEITYWQESARKYPGYRDAYFQLALLEYQLGDAQSSQSYLNKVESIDPNFQEAYKLEKLLSPQK